MVGAACFVGKNEHGLGLAPIGFPTKQWVQRFLWGKINLEQALHLVISPQNSAYCGFCGEK